MCNHLEALLLQMFHPSLFCLSNYIVSSVNCVSELAGKDGLAKKRGGQRKENGSKITALEHLNLVLSYTTIRYDTHQIIKLYWVHCKKRITFTFLSMYI